MVYGPWLENLCIHRFPAVIARPANEIKPELASLRSSHQ
jgi:hypothetical protein